MLIHAFCKICEREFGFFILVLVSNSHKNNFKFTNLRKHMNNQTNWRIALKD